MKIEVGQADILALLGELDVNLRDLKGRNILLLSDNTNLSVDFLLHCMREESRIESKTIASLVQLDLDDSEINLEMGTMQ